MRQPIQISSEFIEENTNFLELINELRKVFNSNSITVPQRHHHDFPNPKTGKDSTLLLMPAWNAGKEAGVKIVTVNPGNDTFGLPSIQGSYLYLDAITGTLKAIMEAKSLTAKRTAAASALASSYLSKKNATSMLMIGTGTLSVNLIKAHASVRPIEQVFVWGRNLKKTEEISQTLSKEKYEVKAIASIDEKISEVDIISCATLSENPLIFGEKLVSGQHVDLVGAYKPNMREADNEAILKTSVFLDTYGGGLKESGDIAVPLKEGILKESDIKADLFGLCGETHIGRTDDMEITLFKSVGHALEDLAAATYYYSKFQK
ncbi:ornithine cyclodeaminase family protein [Flagellimonas pacifica]|uniref:Ornithine cyclodeaminase n=1 Tax=Flagellimonas pacifica TaxID=1247520 RepID=A0A285MUA8_9FLAO|nr:ornithine cyclodeaminase family protein [Allomuricauda parva]SNZ00779.1 ornithine cyclodeaminase [Allomuricauda parva]